MQDAAVLQVVRRFLLACHTDMAVIKVGCVMNLQAYCLLCQSGRSWSERHPLKKAARWQPTACFDTDSGFDLEGSVLPVATPSMAVASSSSVLGQDKLEAD